MSTTWDSSVVSPAARWGLTEHSSQAGRLDRVRVRRPRADSRESWHIPAGLNTPWQEWQRFGTGLTDGRQGTRIISQSSGDLIAIGGHLGDDLLGTCRPSASVDRWSPEDCAWVPLPSLAQARSHHAATRLQNGELLTMGGKTTQHGPWGMIDSASASVERYDPDGRRWTRAAPMTQRRRGHSATPLSDGRILVVGGHDGATTEIYDPRADRWLAGPNLTTPLRNHSAVRLPGDIIVLVGGDRPTPGYPDLEILHAGVPHSIHPRDLPPAPWIGAAAQPDGRLGLVSRGEWALQFGVWDPTQRQFEWLSAVIELPRSPEPPLVISRSDGSLVVLTMGADGLAVTWIVDIMNGDVEGISGPSNVAHPAALSTAAPADGGVLAVDQEHTLFLE